MGGMHWVVYGRQGRGVQQRGMQLGREWSMITWGSKKVTQACRVTVTFSKVMPAICAVALRAL